MGKNIGYVGTGKKLLYKLAIELAVLVLRVLLIPLLHYSLINCISFETTASLLRTKPHYTPLKILR